MLVDDVVGPPSTPLGSHRGPVGAWHLLRLRHGWVYTARVRRPVQRRGGQVGSEAKRVEHCRLCAPEKDKFFLLLPFFGAKTKTCGKTSR